MITSSHGTTEMMMMDTVRGLAVSMGLENVRLKGWAKEAQVSEGSLYYHFDSKEELMKMAYLKSDALFRNELLAIVQRYRDGNITKPACDRIFKEYLEVLTAHDTETIYCRIFTESGMYNSESSLYEDEHAEFRKQISDAFDMKDEKKIEQLVFFFTEPVLSLAADICRDHRAGEVKDYGPVESLLTRALYIILK